MEGNEVRRLREAITDLSKVFNQEIVSAFAEGRNRKKGKGDEVSFSYVIEGAGTLESTKFFELIESYGVDMGNDSQLKNLAIELTHLSRFMGTKLDDLSDIRKRSEFRDVLQEMKNEILSSPVMANLTPEEQQKRLDMLEFVVDEDGELLRGATLDKIEEFVVRLEKESDAARGARMMLRDPDLVEMYEDLRAMEDDLAQEQEYRKEQRTLVTKYNSLCTSYQGLESIDSELRDPKITDRRKSKLEADRKAIIESLKSTMTPDLSERLFGPDGDKEPNQYQLTRTLKKDIEDVAFQVNLANGIVDKEVLARDAFTIVKVDAMQDMEAAYKLTDSKAREEKVKALSKSKDLEMFAKKLELKRKLEELQGLLAELEDLRKAEARYNELKAKPEKDLTEDEKKEMAQLLPKVMKLKNLKSQISTLQKSIKDLAKEFNMGSFEKMNLNNPQTVAKFAIGDVDKSIESHKKYAQARRNEICDKYGVDKKETTENIATQIKAKVAEIESRKRTRIVENAGPGDNSVNAPTNTEVNGGSSQRTPGNATPTPLNYGSRPAPINIPHSSFGNPRYAGAEPMPNNGFGANTNASPSVSQNLGNDLDENTVNAPIDPSSDPNSVENRLSYLMHRTGRVVETIEADDAELQINTIDPERRQRVENGVVYRYARGANPGELYFVEEGLEMYLKNPQKKLESVLKELRERMITELGGEEQLEEYLAQNTQNELLADLVSENSRTRKGAIKDFIAEIDKMNPGNEDMAYVSMAIALNSEIEPEKIDEVIGRASQPYSRPCDMKKYVRTEETKGFLGLGKKEQYVIEPTLLDRNQKREERRAERHKSTLNPKSASDGMLRPFEISAEEKGQAPRKENSPQRENQDPNKKPQRRKPRESNPGDRD